MNVSSRRFAFVVFLTICVLLDRGLCAGTLRAARNQAHSKPQAHHDSKKDEKKSEDKPNKREESKTKAHRSENTTPIVVTSKPKSNPSNRTLSHVRQAVREHAKPNPPNNHRADNLRADNLRADKYRDRGESHELAIDSIRHRQRVREHGRHGNRSNFGPQHRSPHFGPAYSHMGIHFPSNPTPPPCVIVEEHYTPVPYVVAATPVFEQPVVAAPVYMEPVVQPALSTTDFLNQTPLVAPSEEICFVDPWNARFGIEYGSDTDDLSRLGFDLLANKSGGFGVDTEVRIHRESDGEFRDHLWIGDFNIVYELFASEDVRSRAGVGVSWLADSYGAEVGLNLTFGVDVRLSASATLTGDFDFGTLGDADLLHARVTLGFGGSEHAEWFVGYDHLELGGIEIQGIVAGLRFRM